MLWICENDGFSTSLLRESTDLDEWVHWLFLFFLSDQVDDELEIKAYYAGHVIGAAMFHCRVGDHSFVYTGMMFDMRCWLFSCLHP